MAAAEDATGRTVYEDICEFRVRALNAFELTELDMPEQHANLLLEAGRAYSYVGAEERARPCFREARQAATELGLDALRIDATLGYAGPPEDRGGTDDDLITWLQEATDLAVATGHPQSVRLQGRTTFERVLAARREPGAYGMPPVTQILEEAEASGDPVELAWALLSRMLGRFNYYDHPQDRLSLARRMLAVSRDSGERDVEAWAQGFVVIHRLELGDRSGAEAAVDSLAALGPQLLHGYARWGAAVIRPLFALLDGDLAAARRLSDEALNMRVDSLTSIIYQYAQRCLIFREEGDFEAIRPLLEWVEKATQLGGVFGGIDLVVEAAFGALWCDLGRLDEARRVLDHLVARNAPEASDDVLWGTTLGYLTDMCVATGDLRLAPRVYELLERRADQTIVVALAIANLGAFARHLGRLAGLMQRWDDAERHFEAALQINGERLRSALWVAHTHYDYADMLFRRGWAGDWDRARELATLAAGPAGRLGMAALLRKTQGLLARLNR